MSPHPGHGRPACQPLMGAPLVAPRPGSELLLPAAPGATVFAVAPGVVTGTDPLVVRSDGGRAYRYSGARGALARGARVAAGQPVAVIPPGPPGVRATAVPCLALAVLEPDGRPASAYDLLAGLPDPAEYAPWAVDADPDLLATPGYRVPTPLSPPPVRIEAPVQPPARGLGGAVAWSEDDSAGHDDGDGAAIDLGGNMAWSEDDGDGDEDDLAVDDLPAGPPIWPVAGQDGHSGEPGLGDFADPEEEPVVLTVSPAVGGPSVGHRLVDDEDDQAPDDEEDDPAAAAARAAALLLGRPRSASRPAGAGDGVG